MTGHRRIVPVRAFWVIVLALTSIASFVSAPSAAELFVVEDVDVDASATSAAAAREMALAEGQRRAFDILLKRLTLAEDHARHPRLSDDAIADLIQSLEVGNEKTSASRYLATLRFEFKKQPVRDLLIGNDIPFTETVSRPALVLPVLHDAGALNLWDEPNLWLAAWIARERIGTLVPLLAPLGDLQDIAAISARQAIDGDVDRLLAIADRYGVDSTVVALADVGLNPTTGATTLELTVLRQGAGPGDYFTDILEADADADADRTALFAAAVEHVSARLEESWKRETIIRFGDERVVRATVVYGTLSDWIAIRRRLADTAGIRQFDVEALTATEAQVKMHVLSNEGQLATALAQRDLALREQNGVWVVSRTDGGER